MEREGERQRESEREGERKRERERAPGNFFSQLAMIKIIEKSENLGKMRL